MRSAPTIAAAAGKAEKTSLWSASPHPMSTGAAAAGSVLGRAAMIHDEARDTRGAAKETTALGASPREPGILTEVRLSFLKKSVLGLGGLLGHVEEQRRVSRQLLESGLSVESGVEGAL